MRCQLCDNPATVHLTEIINGEKTERHLCQQCAEIEGIAIKSPEIPITELLNDLVAAKERTEELVDLKCPSCGLSWIEFRKRGLLGCPDDYEAFAEPLGQLICQTQNGATSHRGRIPRKSASDSSNQVNIINLRRQLQQAIETEDYETAAHIRDELRKAATE